VKRLVGRIEIDDDAARIDHDAVWRILSEEVAWGRWRSREVIEHQLGRAWRMVGAYDQAGRQVGFARAISDGYGVAYVADVFVAPAYRGGGVGSAIVQMLIDGAPQFRWMLHTADAHAFYQRLGFAPPPPTYLERPPRI
jgi:GNAT superfamily N-acetyltransferase